MGRLSAPFSTISIRQITNDDADSISRSLREMIASGMPETSIAHTLELLASALLGRPRLEDEVQLVTTGPELSGTTNRDTSVVVADLFGRAEKSVAVIGYAVYQGQKVFQALAKRMAERPALNVRLYLDITRKPGDTTMDSELVNRFCHNFRKTQWPSGAPLPEIYYDPRSIALNRVGAASLHAKCVVVDAEKVLISSANFTEAGQTRNIELGLLLTSQPIGQKILQFLNGYVGASYLKRAT
jgi:phosphatidylserine/phosphatidylglycerophosphate/cardiolipin synthase-like enzyme